MLRLLTPVRKPGIILSAVLTVSLLAPGAASAVSVSPVQVKLAAENPQASVNGAEVRLDEPPAIINDRFYVPVKWISETLGMKLDWDPAEGTIRFITDKAYIELNSAQDSIKVNGIQMPFHAVAEIRNDRLLVQLAWLAQYAGLSYRYVDATRSVELDYLPKPLSPYKESLLRNDDAQPNSKPAALFAFGKPAYRLGEPVEYVDLSYDPDAEGLPVYDWGGKRDVFFKPGTYAVTLTVEDGKGNRSDPFTRTVEVLDEPYLSESEYPLYMKPIGTLMKWNPADWPALRTVSDLHTPPVVSETADRPLLKGTSSKPVEEPGFLYQGTVSKQARLSPQYTNGTDQPVRFAIVLRNASESKPVTVASSKKAEAPISVYTSRSTARTAEDFLAFPGGEPESISLEPGASAFYKVSGEVAPGQTFHGIYDMETDGELQVSYVMIRPEEQPYDLGKYRLVTLPEDHSPIAPASETDWKVDLRGYTAPIALRPEKGMESTPPQAAKVQADEAVPSGAVYHFSVDTTGKTAVVLHPEGGFFQGAIRVNGMILSLPDGGLTSNDSILIHRSQAWEGHIDIELLPVSGDCAPFELLYVPLADKK